MPKTIGVIGLGSIGMRHAKNLRVLGHNVRAYDTDINRQMAFNGVLFTIDNVLDSDAVVIASPTAEHNNHIILSRMASAPPVFVEKPIGHKPLLPIQLDRVAMVGYNLRFHACVKEAKRWITDEMPVWATFTCAQKNNKPAYLRDGIILNWSHEIDLALYLLGPAEVVASSTRLSRPGTSDSDINTFHAGLDDISDILLRHENGCRTVIHLDYVTEPQERHFTIQCEGVRLKADLIGNVLAEVPEHGPVDMQTYPNTFDDNYIEEMQAFIDLIDGKPTFACTGEEGLKVLEICLKVREQAGL